MIYKTFYKATHLEYCIRPSAWSHHYDKDMEFLKKVQRRFTRMFTELRGDDYYESLRHLN